MASRRQLNSQTTTRFQKDETNDGDNNPDFDTILESIGEFGWAQRLHIVIMCYAGYCRAMIMVAAIFLCKTPNFDCKDRPADDPCLLDPPCEKFVYDTRDNFTSIVTEWDLVCEKNEYAGLTQSAAMFGFMLGTFFLAPSADQYGRWRVMVFGQILMLVCHLTTAYSMTYNQFIATRFIMGFGLGGTLASTVWVIENLHSKWRSMISLIHNSAYAVGIVLLTGLAYCFRDWRDLTFYSTCCMIPYVFLCWLIPESPRWLLSKGRVSEAENILIAIGQTNGINVSRDQLSLAKITLKTNKSSDDVGDDVGDDAKSSDDVGDDVKGSSVIDVFRSPVMRTRMLALLWIWVTCVMVYYSLTMGASNLGGNMYVNVALSGLTELPATSVAAYFCNRSGRKSTTIMCTLLGAIGCVAVGLLPQQAGDETTQYQTIFAMIGKTGISCAFALLYIYTGELLPTVVRGSALGLCSTVGRIGGILGPVIAAMGDTFAYLIYGSMCLLSCILCLSLPETLNKSLPETIQEVEEEHKQRLEKKQL